MILKMVVSFIGGLGMQIKNVELWRSGQTTDGREISVKEVKQAYENSKLLLTNGYKIPIKLGHGDTGQDAKGWIVNLRYANGSLFGDFTNLDNETYNKIIEGKLPERSAEIWSNVFWNNKKYKTVLKAVALLGIDTPSIFLNPIEAYENDELYTAYNLNAINNIGGQIMPENTNLIQENIELKNKLKELENKKFETFQKENAELSGLVEKYQKEVAERDTKLAEYKKLEEERKEQEKVKYFEKLGEDVETKLIKTGKLAPVDKAMVLQAFEAIGYNPDLHGQIMEIYQKFRGTDLTTESVDAPESQGNVEKYNKYDVMLGNVPEGEK